MDDMFRVSLLHRFPDVAMRQSQVDVHRAKYMKSGCPHLVPAVLVGVDLSSGFESSDFFSPNSRLSIRVSFRLLPLHSAMHSSVGLAAFPTVSSSFLCAWFRIILI
jgi:hypothetical protein